MSEAEASNTDQGKPERYLMALRVYPTTDGHTDYTGVDWEAIQEAIGESLHISEYGLTLRITDDALEKTLIETGSKGAKRNDGREFAQVLTAIINDDAGCDIEKGPIPIREIWNFLHHKQDRTHVGAPSLIPQVIYGPQAEFQRFMQDTAFRYRIDLEKQMGVRSRKKKRDLYVGTLPEEIREVLSNEFGVPFQQRCRYAPWAMIAETYEKPKRWRRRKRTRVARAAKA